MEYSAGGMTQTTLPRSSFTYRVSAHSSGDPEDVSAALTRTRSRTGVPNSSVHDSVMLSSGPSVLVTVKRSAVWYPEADSVRVALSKDSTGSTPPGDPWVDTRVLSVDPGRIDATVRSRAESSYTFSENALAPSDAPYSPV